MRNNLFHIHFNWPLRTWWKARKYFVRPKRYIYFFFTHSIRRVDKEEVERFGLNAKKIGRWYFYHSVNYHSPYMSGRYLGRIVDFKASDVMWKWKWDEVRHEGDPYIYFCLFRLFGFVIHYKIRYITIECEERDGGLYYWEYLLNYLYKGKSLKITDTWTYRSKIYKNGDDDYTVIVDTPRFSLNKNGMKELRRLYNIKRW